MNKWTVAWLPMIALAAAGLLGFGGCQGGDSRDKNPIALGDRVDMAASEELTENAFTKLYQPVEITVSPRIPSYDLPLQAAQATNYADFSQKVDLEAALPLLERQGFAVLPGWTRSEVSDAYETVKSMEVPVFITSDSLLHLYHIQFGNTLKEIEEKQFYAELVELTGLMQDAAQDQYDTLAGDLHEAARRNWAYFTVARKLLEPEAQVPRQVREQVDAELVLIEAHGGAQGSPLFVYKEDYSQYVPRGHYTRSENLQRYFKAMMWYGRIGMLLVGTDMNPAALVDQKTADMQSLQAALIAGALSAETADTTQARQLVRARQIWQRIYEVTAFYVGIADDLTPSQYSQALREVVGTSLRWQVLTEEGTLQKLREQLAAFGAPRIYGGTGQIEIAPPFTPQQLAEGLGLTSGLRFMGQRFIPDSYMMGKLVVPTVGNYTGSGQPFTLVQSAGGPVRGFPRGLDVLSAMGSDRAAKLLEEAGDTAYRGYDEAITQLRAEFAQMPPSAWHKNLYWAWLHSLKALIEPISGEGWPTFMTTPAWQDKSLHGALASWAQLRHDTILYAKQSYTVRTTAMPLPREPVVGYVEPVPELYARLLSLTRMTREGLSSLEALDENAAQRLDSLAEILQRLLDMSQKQLANEALTEDDYKFIEDFGQRLEYVVAGVEQEGLETTIVADVHTDGNSGQVLEEATGYLNLMVVAYRLPAGNIVLGAGPVLSYYEFKHPASDRLTDEAWKQLLRDNRAPSRPEWTSSFVATSRD